MFICIKLMIPVWVRLLFKMYDLVVYGPLGETFWPSSIHKSFVLGFISSLLPHRPWRLMGAPKVLGPGRKVYLLLRDIIGYAGSVLRQFRLLQNRVASMPGVLAR